MGTPTTEFVFLPAKDSVRPENASSDEGKAFLDFLSSKKSKFAALLWGRSPDMPELLGIAAEILSPEDSFPVSDLSPFQSAAPSTLRVKAKAVDFAANPVTEVAILPLREDLTDADITQLSKDAQSFGSALLQAVAPMAYSGKMALTYKCGWAAGAPNKPANRLVMMIGWRDVQNHLESTTTVVFVSNLKPIVEKVAGELDVTHYEFREI